MLVTIYESSALLSASVVLCGTPNTTIMHQACLNVKPSYNHAMNQVTHLKVVQSP